MTPARPVAVLLAHAACAGWLVSIARSAYLT